MMTIDNEMSFALCSKMTYRHVGEELLAMMKMDFQKIETLRKQNDTPTLFQKVGFGCTGTQCRRKRGGKRKRGGLYHFQLCYRSPMKNAMKTAPRIITTTNTFALEALSDII